MIVDPQCTVTVPDDNQKTDISVGWVVGEGNQLMITVICEADRIGGKT